LAGLAVRLVVPDGSGRTWIQGMVIGAMTVLAVFSYNALVRPRPPH
jgi:hypothetical protein